MGQIERDALRPEDLVALAKLADMPLEELQQEVRSHPWRIHDLLSDPDLAEAAVSGSDPADVLSVTPFIFFAVLVHRCANELALAEWVSDWAGPKSRLPVFDVDPLVDFAQRPDRLLYLARLLSSFVMPDVGVLPVPVNALDLDGMVSWLRSVEVNDRPVVLSRLGDAALFLAGVCPDRTGSQMLSAAAAIRLGESVGLAGPALLELIDPGSSSPGLDALERLGSLWYSAAAAQPSCELPSLTLDVARHMRPARRFLNHLADRYLQPTDLGFGLGLA